MKTRSLLRVLRWEKQPKLSQRYVARRAGMGIFRYWQIENGEGLPVSADEKKAIAAVLDVKISDIAWPDVQPSARAPQRVSA